MKEKPNTNKEKLLTIVMAILVVAIVVASVIATNFYVLAYFVAILLAVGGLAAFLKLKSIWARILGLMLFGLTLFWMCFFPAWLDSFLYKPPFEPPLLVP